MKYRGNIGEIHCTGEWSLCGVATACHRVSRLIWRYEFNLLTIFTFRNLFILAYLL